jgi:hypothetical protein
MTEDEAIKLLAARLGRMEVIVGVRWRIMLMDDADIILRMFPFYGETFEEALRAAVICKFGEDFIGAAIRIIEDLTLSNKEIYQSLIDANDWLKNRKTT